MSLKKVVARIVLLLIFLGPCFCEAGAQSASSTPLPEGIYLLSGQILEKGNKDPVLGGSLYLEALANTEVAQSDEKPLPKPISADADLKGNYQLAVAAGSYRLIVAGEGFKRLTLVSFSITQDTKKSFFLERDGFTLPEVLVSTDKISRTQVSHETLSKEELSEVPGTQEDVLKALQALPSVNTTGSLDGELLVRGNGPEDNQYYVDNIPIGYPYHFGITSTIDSNLLKDIDFYAGGFGPQFPNSMGGVIDLTQREGREDRWGFRADVNLFLSEGELEGPITSNSSLAVAYRRSYLDLFIGNFSGSQGNIQVPQFSDYQVKYSWNPSAKVHMDFVALGSADVIGGNLSASATVAQQDPELAGALSFTEGYNSQGFNFKDTSDDQNTFANTFYHSNTYFNYLLGAGLYENNGVENFGDKVSVIHEFDTDTSFEGGVEYDHFIDSLNAYFFVIPTGQQQNFNVTTANKINAQSLVNSDDLSAYVNQQFKTFNRKLEISVGARLDYVNSDFAVFLTPRLSAAYHLTEITTLKASYGYFDESPDRIVGYPFLDPNLGNSHLAPEQSIASVVGIEQLLSTSGLMFRAEGYEKDFSSLIVSNPNATPGQGYLNSGTGYARGVELFLRQPPTERFFGWISYALSDSQRQDNPGSYLYPYDYDEPNVLNVVGNFKINPGWDLGAKFLYTTGHPYTPVNSAGTTVVNSTTFYLPQYGPTDSARLPDYVRLDFSTSIKTVYDTWEWRIYLDMTNILGTKNVLQYEYNTDYSQKTAVYDLPFLPYLGFEVKY
jgi:hypothetical protein